MTRAIHSMLLIQLGIILLGMVAFTHLFEHWETAAFEKCVSACEHSHASSQSDADGSPHAGHHHGCSGHEHSPAILQTNLPFLPQPIVLASPEIRITLPPSIAEKIDHPPRLS